MAFFSTKFGLCALILIQVIGACCCWAEMAHTHELSDRGEMAAVWADNSDASCHEHDDCVPTAPVRSSSLAQLPPLDLAPAFIDTKALDLLLTNRTSLAMPCSLADRVAPAICLPLII